MIERTILYSFRRCPYAMRARMAVHASGIVCELREIVLRDKAPAFLAASPKGTVPVLVTADGTVVEESLDVMLWALRQNDPERWLVAPSGDFETMMTLIAVTEDDFKAHLDAYKYAHKGEADARNAARDRGAEFLLELAERLRAQPYLFGDRPALADLAIFPFVRQFANVDRDWFDTQDWPNLISWLDGFLESPRFPAVMKKYAKWQADDEPVLFP